MAPSLSQLHPLHINPTTGEVYLRLPHPHQNIIITPPRASDAPAITSNLNDSRIFQTLNGPLYPYLPEHAREWLVRAKQGSDSVLAELQEAADREVISPITVGDCPVRALREQTEDGTDTFLGDLTISRCGRFDLVGDKGKEEEMVKQIWQDLSEIQISCGTLEAYYLVASHHGQGIMTVALKTLMHEWAIPRMNVRKMQASAFKGNIGSVRVFEKNGFVMKGTVESCVEIPESRGGGKVGMHFLEWKKC